MCTLDDNVSGKGAGEDREPLQLSILRKKLTKHPIVQWFDECVHMC